MTCARPVTSARSWPPPTGPAAPARPGRHSCSPCRCPSGRSATTPSAVTRHERRPAAARTRSERQAPAPQARRDAPPRPRAAVTARPSGGTPEFLRTLIDAGSPPAMNPMPAPACNRPRSPSPRPCLVRRHHLVHPAGNIRLPRRLEWIRGAEHCLARRRRFPRPGRAGSPPSTPGTKSGTRRRRPRRDPLPGPGRQLRRPRHRHPAPQRPHHLQQARLRPAR